MDGANDVCAACGHDKFVHGPGHGDGRGYCDDRHEPHCNCNGFVSRAVVGSVVDRGVPSQPLPIAMRIPCPECHQLHIDVGEFATKPHHTHACQHCGAVWRPAIVNTVGVRFLPGFKNEPEVA